MVHHSSVFSDPNRPARDVWAALVVPAEVVTAYSVPRTLQWRPTTDCDSTAAVDPSAGDEGVRGWDGVAPNGWVMDGLSCSVPESNRSAAAVVAAAERVADGKNCSRDHRLRRPDRKTARKCRRVWTMDHRNAVPDAVGADSWDLRTGSTRRPRKVWCALDRTLRRMSSTDRGGREASTFRALAHSMCAAVVRDRSQSGTGDPLTDSSEYSAANCCCYSDCPGSAWTVPTRRSDSPGTYCWPTMTRVPRPFRRRGCP